MTYKYKGQSILDDKKTIRVVKKYASQGKNDIEIAEITSLSKSQVNRIRKRNGIVSGYEVARQDHQRKRERLAMMIEENKGIAKDIEKLTKQEWADSQIAKKFKLTENEVYKIRVMFSIKSGEHYRNARYLKERETMVPHVRRLALEEKNDQQIADELDEILSFEVTISRVAKVRYDNKIKSGMELRTERLKETLIDVWNKTKSDVEVSRALGVSRARARVKINNFIDNGIIEGERIGIDKKAENIYKKQIDNYKGPQFFETKRLKNMPAWIAGFIRAERLNHGVVV